MSTEFFHSKIYIIIVTYNGMQWIDKCLQSCKNYKIILVDNNSSDQTVTYVKINFPDVVVLSQNINLGFGAGNNIGISYALNIGAEYVLLLNQDAYLKKDTIFKLLQTHRIYPEFGVLSPIHLNGNGDKLDEKFSSYLSYKSNDKFYFDALLGRLKNIYCVPFVNAATWLLPKQTIELIGGFDPIFFHYGEDDNYCQRLNFHNLKFGVVTNSYVLHDREYRVVKKDLTTTAQSLKLKERSLKNKWANINYDAVEVDINNTKSKLNNIIYKLILKLKFAKAIRYKNELDLIKRIVPQIMESRTTNKVKGCHYLTINNK